MKFIRKTRKREREKDDIINDYKFDFKNKSRQLVITQ